MLYGVKFESDHKNQEIIPMDETSFPYVCKYKDTAEGSEKAVPWHWHTAFEIDYVTEGTMEYKIPDKTITLQKGEMIFLNTGVLHASRMVGDTPCKEYTHLFDMHFLSGLYNSVFEEKYFLPISRSSVLQVWHIRPDSYEKIKMIEAVLKAAELSKNEPEGYEFDIRTALCDFWRLLLKDMEELRASEPQYNAIDTERIKTMMEFIQDNCGEKLTLEQIAASASISTRECTRCFKRSVSLSPIVYLTQCRVRNATKLLKETSMSIIEISEECGFSSPSYFGKVFRELVGITPKEYRNSMR